MVRKFRGSLLFRTWEINLSGEKEELWGYLALIERDWQQRENYFFFWKIETIYTNLAFGLTELKKIAYLVGFVPAFRCDMINPFTMFDLDISQCF